MTSLGIIPRKWVRDNGRYRLDGLQLPEYGLFLSANGFTVGVATPTTTYTDIPGRDGSYDLTFTNDLDAAFLPRRTVTMTLGCVGIEADFIQSQLKLAALHGQSVTMRDTMQPGYWQGRCTVGEWDIERNSLGCFVQASVEVSIDALPYMVGNAESQTFTSGSNRTIYVPGNTTTYPTLRVTPTSGATSAVSIQVRDTTETTYSRVLKLNPSTGEWGTITLNVDMANGEVYQDSGNVYYDIDMTTDFWSLNPGRQVVRVVNASGSITWEGHYVL